MIIKNIAIGNEVESYIENKISSGFNIISSDDNNKGKTIVIQSIAFALGNKPTFPSSFNYKDYMFVVEFEENSIVYKLFRKKDTFILRYNRVFMLFDSVSEFKRYWSKHITKLPEIYKNEMLRIVDPELIIQTFFLGQDKKDTSNIVNSGLYNKADFISMIYSMCGQNESNLSIDEVSNYKKLIKDLESKKSLLLKKHKILNSNENSMGYLSSVNDKLKFEKKVKNIDKINEKILELRKERNRIANRKSKWDATIKELRSLNRNIEVGELKCLDCHSTNISYISADKNSYAFDVSTVEMRNEIFSSINEKIEIYSEELEKCEVLLSLEQEKLTNLLSESDITLENIIEYKESFFTASDAEREINEINIKIKEIKNKLILNNKKMSQIEDSKSNIMQEIITIMNETYRAIDDTSNMEIEGLFTKRDQVYSGSESTVFHIVRLYALQKVLKHNYPIIIDSFRAEDLSSHKEGIVIDLFRKLNNQVIFTTTIKEEEIGKYDNQNYINHIDYLGYTPYKLLSEKHNDMFRKILLEMKVEIN